MKDGLNAPHAKQETLENRRPLRSCLIRCRVTGKLTSVCISDCGIRSGLTLREEQEEMLFFTLLSVFWTNID